MISDIGMKIIAEGKDFLTDDVAKAESSGGTKTHPLDYFVGESPSPSIVETLIHS